jgi:hypothetical protein
VKEIEKERREKEEVEGKGKEGKEEGKREKGRGGEETETICGSVKSKIVTTITLPEKLC